MGHKLRFWFAGEAEHEHCYMQRHVVLQHAGQGQRSHTPTASAYNAHAPVPAASLL
jgi:hypothetical protein